MKTTKPYQEECKKIKGYKTHETMDVGLIGKALEKAMKSHPSLTGAIHHSDPGSQYTSAKYLRQLADYGLRSSLNYLTPLAAEIAA